MSRLSRIIIASVLSYLIVEKPEWIEELVKIGIDCYKEAKKEAEG